MIKRESGSRVVVAACNGSAFPGIIFKREILADPLFRARKFLPGN